MGVLGPQSAVLGGKWSRMAFPSCGTVMEDGDVGRHPSSVEGML